MHHAAVESTRHRDIGTSGHGLPERTASQPAAFLS
jgi:hypothetical protein